MDLSNILELVFADIRNIQKEINSLPVTRTIGLLNDNIRTLKDQKTPLDELYTAFKSDIQPYLSISRSPRNFSFITGGITDGGMIGELLVPLFDQNVMANSDTSRSIAPIIEDIVIKQLTELFSLHSFTGTLTTGATMSNLVGIRCGLQWIGNQNGIDISQDGMFGLGKVEVFANCPHSCVLKVLSVLGLGHNSIVKIKGLEKDSTVMDTSDLELKLKESFRNSTTNARIIIAAAGDVNTGSFDDLETICELGRKYESWVHVDGAFGLFAQCSPKYSHLTKGIQLADSITSDGHKWLNVGYDCGLFFVNTKHDGILNSVFSTSAAYIPGSDSPMNRSLENSKRFRALPIWFSLKSLGKNGYTTIIENNCQFAFEFGNWINRSKHYSLLAPVQLNIVLFKAENGNTRDILKAINETGLVFMTGTVHNNEYGIRCAVSNWSTTIERDFKILVDVMNQVLIDMK
ncbi:pyridoxal phosphate-dependent transferase [Globomyces pollinis-pini]|nr:pyridoxal phosphate-dependent transferase [Globomyces pollinis-pini]